jgi:hypothetical protein
MITEPQKMEEAQAPGLLGTRDPRILDAYIVTGSIRVLDSSSRYSRTLTPKRQAA